jgi:hypothetical protein
VTVRATALLFIFGASLTAIEPSQLAKYFFSQSTVNYPRMIPIVALLLVIPICLAIHHRRHVWPAWLKVILAETAAGWIGYILSNHLFTRHMPQLLDIPALIVIWAFSAGVSAAAVALFHQFRTPKLVAPFCPQCGYHLVGLSVNRCPECGRDFNLGELGVSSADLAIEE